MMKITREGQVYLPDDPCREREKDIFALLHGEIPEEKEKDLLSHLETCAGCKSLLELHEMIDDGLRFYFQSRTLPPPAELPKKIRLMLSEVRRDQLARWMCDLGRSILYQQTRAVDRIQPWGELLSIGSCVKAIENICRFTLEDQFLKETELQSSLVADCYEFARNLTESPENLFNVNNSKAALDRSLAINPDSMHSVKLLGDYYYLTKDYQSAVNEFKRAVRITNDISEKNSFYLLLCSTMTTQRKYEEAIAFAEKACGICDDYRVDFLRFINYCCMNDNNRAREYIIRMDSRIEATPKCGLNPEAIALISKWFARTGDSVIVTSKDNDIRRVVIKYTNKISLK